MFGVRLRVGGKYACFTRPEMKVERVSYDVMTPSAARGILEAIHWKPAIVWRIDRIHVLKRIQFQSIRRNEVGKKIPMGSVRTAKNRGSIETLYTKVEDDRQQRAATVLVNVDYAIEAHFDMTDEASESDNVGKHSTSSIAALGTGSAFTSPVSERENLPQTTHSLRTTTYRQRLTKAATWAGCSTILTTQTSGSRFSFAPK